MQIAGAGAGKTYDLAEITLKESKKNNKKIFAITFTNFAKNNIIKNIIEQNNFVPTNVEITTIHTFLLYKVIYPYSYIILGKKYNKSTSMKLPENIKYKNYSISKLETNGIIHNERVFNVAKQIIVGNKSITKKQKQKRKIVLEHIKSEIGAIFIDESQDVSDDVIEIIKKFAENNIYVYMVGDPKQSIKYSSVLRNFIKDIETGEIEKFEKKKNKNTTRRIPSNIVKISNTYCPKDEIQISLSKISGNIFYLYSDDNVFDKIYNEYVKKDALIYIKRSTEEFSTKKNNRKIEFTEFLKNELLKNKNKFDDEDAYLKEKNSEMESLIIECKDDENEALKNFLLINNIPIPIPKDKYIEILKAISSRKNHAKYYVDSIDNIKGLEHDKCMFILDNSMLDYLFKNKVQENKELAYLYVGLTRSKEQLLLVVDVNSTKKTKEYMNQKFKELNIKEFKDTDI